MIDKQCNFQQCIFSTVKDENGSMSEKLYTVGGTGKQMLVRCYNEKDNNEIDITIEAKHGTKMLTGLVEL